eukprot:XP_001697682.1 predicted protein [Chlamydomonas reinhardtii]
MQQQGFRSVQRPAQLQARCRCQPYRPNVVIRASLSDSRPHMVAVSFRTQYKCDFGQALALVGDSVTLGSWKGTQAQRMKWTSGDQWTCTVALPAGSALECKYIVVDERTGREVRWQEGGNMLVTVPASVQSLPVEQYETRISWCKQYSSFKAHPLTSAAADAVLSGASLAGLPVATPPPGMAAGPRRSAATPSSQAATAAAGPQAAYSDSDEEDDEVSEHEARVAHALTAPVTAADMAALLKNMGTALGHSVRLRHGGVEPAAADLLELDRQIALQCSKLYRKRDNLLRRIAMQRI